MINAISDFYRPDLPRQILYAQARAPKLMLERGIPCQMLTFVSYLVSITNLNRSGNLLYSRSKAAEICEVTDRTLDRYLGQLEAYGVIARRDRKRSPDGTFFGTAATWCSNWWHDLFVAPTRSSVARALDSTSAPRQSSPERTLNPMATTLAAASGATVETEIVRLSELSTATRKDGIFSAPFAVFQEPVQATSPSRQVHTPYINKTINKGEVESGLGDLDENFNHATFQSDSTGGFKDIKRLSFNNAKNEKSQGAEAPDFSKNSEKPKSESMHLPNDLAQLLKPLNLSAKSIRLLMWAAKKTDLTGSKSRLQDAVRHAMDRILALGLMGDHAGRYLFKCLFSGEDYKAKLAMKEDQSEQDNATRLANAFRDSLRDGQSVDCAGRICVRNGYAVFIQGNAGGGLRPLTLEQMAVMATRCGLV